RLARVDVGHDPDVADPGQVKRSGSHKASVFSRSRWGLRLPAVVREGLVGLGHLVRVLALLHSGTEAVAGIEELVEQTLGHGLLPTGAGVTDQPAQCQRVGTAGLDLDRDLVGGTTDTAGLGLEGRLDVVESALQRDDRVVAGLLTQALHGAVNDALGGGALSV